MRNMTVPIPRDAYRNSSMWLQKFCPSQKKFAFFASETVETHLTRSISMVSRRRFHGNKQPEKT
jgi:hypothetical protein